MADETKSGIIICTRNTYNNRKDAGELDPTTVYFVIENVTDAEQYLSLYVGEAKQTDVVSLNSLTAFTDKTTIEAIQQFIQSSGAPAKNLLTKDKIYYWEDTSLNVMRLFMRGTDNIIPIYSEPLWEDI